jgi:hypothetical protein
MTATLASDSSRITRPYAEATWEFWNSVYVRFAWIASTVVPVPASAMTVANTSNANTVRRISAVRRVGRNSGSRTWRTRCHGPAWNTSAASR